MRATELAPGLAAAHPSLFWVEGIVQIPLARWAVPVFFMMSGALILDPWARNAPSQGGTLYLAHGFHPADGWVCVLSDGDRREES
jgi:hypothetical protein